MAYRSMISVNGLKSDKTDQWQLFTLRSTAIKLFYNGFGLCVRWGFPALKLILKTKI